MSGGPKQVYFSDGISEDVITELSRFRELWVIARNSTYSFRGQSVDVRDGPQARSYLRTSLRGAGNCSCVSLARQRNAARLHARRALRSQAGTRPSVTTNASR